MTQPRHNKFAKLFETEKFGQVLCFKDENKYGQPIVAHMLWSSKFGSNITYKAEFKDNDKGWKDRDFLFEKLDEENLIKALEEMDLL